MRKNVVIVILGISIICCLSVYTAIAQNKGATIANNNLDTASADFNHRFALVIGNAAYPNNKLNNPVNDARDMSALLDKYGFKVLLDTNASRLQMNRDINSFGDSILANKGIGLFYFSGHGMQYNGKNFLLPLDYNLKSASDIEDESVPLNKVYEKLSAFKNGRNFVILDACRDNPFYKANPGYPKGLNDNTSHPSNAILFFSTEGGSVAADGAGKNSPFTASLVSSITAYDSIEFCQLVKKVVRDVKQKTDEVQVPDMVGSPDMDFYFKKKAVEHKPNLFVLSIGIARYYYIPRLMYPENDARNFAAIFKQTEAADGKNLYQTVYNYTLTDDSATKKEIEASILSIKKQAREGDMILVYNNGHFFTDSVGKTYFLLARADLHHPEENGVDTKEIFSLLTEMPCKSLLFLDGTISKSRINGVLTYDAPILKDLTSPENNVVVFLAGSPNELTYESSKFNGGLFMYGIKNALINAESTDHPGYVDVGVLARYVKRFVREASEGQQNPLIIFPKGWQNFVLAKKRP